MRFLNGVELLGNCHLVIENTNKTEILMKKKIISGMSITF